MKIRLISLIMALLMCVILLCACKANNTETTDVTTDITTGNNSDVVEAIPSSYTLVGTEHLPPIDNQGGVGCCASNAITYMQFSNAVSRYLHSINPDIEWSPLKSTDYRFTPKLTYLWSGAGTAWVYDILKDHGGLTMDKSSFFKGDSNDSQIIRTKDHVYPQSASWDVSENLMQTALNYRITNYEQVWVSEAPYKTSEGTCFTTSKAGIELLDKIKAAIARGNVVVTGGFSGSWQYTNISRDGLGDLGKASDKVIYYSKNDKNGAHQVSIVGYDDNITVTYKGVKMKGAFLIANSWGTSWANKGYCWMLYDAVNDVSEYTELNNIIKPENRALALDQFDFLYWDKDVVTGLPDLSVKVDISTVNREGFYCNITRTDIDGNTQKQLPMLFNYGDNFINVHPKDVDSTLTFYAAQNSTKAETGYFVFNLTDLLKDIPEGQTFENYLWGVEIYSTGKDDVAVKEISLINSKGEIISEIVPEILSATIKVSNSGSTDSDKSSENKSSAYVIDLGKGLKNTAPIGCYYLINAATKQKLSTYSQLLISTDDDKGEEDSYFNIKYDNKKKTYVINKNDTEFVLDIRGKEVKDGAEVKFNKAFSTRITNTWTVEMNSDNSMTIYLDQKDDNGIRYAVGLKDGLLCLVSGEDVNTCGKWNYPSAAENKLLINIDRYKHTVVVKGTLPDDSDDKTLRIRISDIDGNIIKTLIVTADSENSYITKTELDKGTFLFTPLTSSGSVCGTQYIYTITQ